MLAHRAALLGRQGLGAVGLEAVPDLSAGKRHDFFFALETGTPMPFEQAGIGVDAAKWLAARDVAAVGADNSAVEAIPFDGNEFLAVHLELLVQGGITLPLVLMPVRPPMPLSNFRSKPPVATIGAALRGSVLFLKSPTNVMVNVVGPPLA